MRKPKPTLLYVVVVLGSVVTKTKAHLFKEGGKEIYLCYNEGVSYINNEGNPNAVSNYRVKPGLGLLNTGFMFATDSKKEYEVFLSAISATAIVQIHQPVSILESMGTTVKFEVGAK